VVAQVQSRKGDIGFAFDARCTMLASEVIEHLPLMRCLPAAHAPVRATAMRAVIRIT
jgi:hypothetical protein